MAEGEKIGAIRPTLFIGLGGTGKEVLLRLRRKFYERCGEPTLPCTAFLWLDTDTRDVMAQGEPIDEIYQAVQFREEEKLALLEGRVSNLSDVFRNRSHWHHVHDWLYSEVDSYGREISDGAGGVRAVGRLTYFYRYPDIRQRIEALLGPQGLNSQEVIDRTRDVFQRLKLPAGEFIIPPTPQVFLVFSIAGGTGCGMFLDVAFLLRDLNIDRVFGIAFLPTVYYPTPFGELAVRSYGNAYAALKELEFYTFRQERPTGERKNGTDGGDAGVGVEFEAEWRAGEQKSIKGPPFTATYFIGMMNEGRIGLQTRPELFAMVGESLFLDFMPSQFSTNKRSHYANVAQYLASPEARDIRVQGQAMTLSQSFARRYGSFGMSKIEIPVDIVKGACTAQLAHDIINYWNREGDDQNIRRNVEDAMAVLQVDAKGIVARFGEMWKDRIKDEIAFRCQGLHPKEIQDLEEIEARMTECEKKLLRSDGQDPSLWGEVVNSLRGSTTQVIEQAKKDIVNWIRDSLENQARGVRSMVKDGGYLHFLETQIRGYHVPLEQAHIPEFTKQKEEAERDVAYWKREKEKQLTDLRAAMSRHFVLKIFGLQEATINTLLLRFRDAEQQYALALAEICLCEEARKVAEALQGLLAEKKSELAAFAGSLPGIAADLDRKKRSFLNFSDSVLFVRHFNEAEDFKNFYKLDGKSVHTPTAHGELLSWLLTQRKALFPVDTPSPATLLDVINAVALRKGDGEIRTGLNDFCEEKFRGDFNAFPREVAVLEHPYMVNNWNDSIEKLVRCALPMVEREKVLAGSTVAAQSLIYVQMSKDPARDERYRRFYDDVSNRLVAQGYNQANITPCFDESRAAEVVLYIASYAFPLPSLPVIKDKCHQSYYDFYRAQVTGHVEKQQNHIPLHLSKKWEGKFGDLKVYDDKEAREVKGALEILLFGSILRVLDLRQKKGVLEYGYRKRIPPTPQREQIGNQREAVETLKGDQRFREQLLRAIREREEGLNLEQLQDYYWLLSYLSRNGEHPSGTPERTLVDEKLNAIYEKWLPQRNVHPENDPEWNISADGNLSAEEEEKQTAKMAQEKLGNRVLWIGEAEKKEEESRFPVLKALDLWVRE